MREMKDSGVEWIGEIPVEWKCSKIKHHFKIGSGTTPKSDIPSYWDGDIVWITPADFKTDDVYVSEGHRNLTQEGFESSNLEIIPAGNIIFSKRAPIGQVVINSVDLCTNQGCLTAVPLDKSNVKYYRYAMSVATNQFELAGSGTTFNEISATAFGNFILPSPNVSEQKKITEYLDRKCANIDSVIIKQQVIVEKLKEYKLSIITEIVSKGFNEQGEKITTGLKWQPYSKKDWRKYRIKNICTFYNGDRSSNYPNPEDFIEDGIPFLGADSLNDFYVDRFVAKHITREKYESMSGLKIEHGDILYTLRGSTIGKSALSDFNDGTVASSLMGIRVKAKQQVNYRYLFYWFQSNNEFVQRDICINGSTAPNLSAENVKNFILYLPKMSEQNRAVAQMDVINENIDRAIVARMRMIESLQKYKKSLIYEVVTGKREV